MSIYEIPLHAEDFYARFRRQLTTFMFLLWKNGSLETFSFIGQKNPFIHQNQIHQYIKVLAAHIVIKWFLNLMSNQGRVVDTRWKLDDELKTTINISNRLLDLTLI